MSVAFRVDCDDSGFSITGPNEVRVLWSEVLEVAAYTEDVWSFDIICLVFRPTADDRCWEVGEDYGGYSELLAGLPARFPGLRTNRFQEVAFPAFAAKWTTFWGKSHLG